jgi:putative flippase GtrA
MDELAISPRQDSSIRATLLRHAPPFGVILRFLVTGGSVAALHLALVSAMVLLGVHIQLALIASYLVSLTVHFTLNRQWVFASGEGYAFHLTLQGVRYLCTAAISYGGSATGVAVLPGLLGIPQLAAFFLATGAMTCITFVVLHLWVFRAAQDRAA